MVLRRGTFDGMFEDEFIKSTKPRNHRRIRIFKKNKNILIAPTWKTPGQTLICPGLFIFKAFLKNQKKSFQICVLRALIFRLGIKPLTFFTALIPHIVNGFF